MILRFANLKAVGLIPVTGRVLQAPDEIWGLPLQPVEAAANMLIARVGFDLLRSPAFQAAASAYVQKKLDQLRLPPYIGPLKARSSHSVLRLDRVSKPKYGPNAPCIGPLKV